MNLKPISFLSVDDAKVFEFKSFVSGRGSLVALASESDIPFGVKRIFYVFNVPPGDTRGEHAHHRCQQLLICVSGECEVLLDDGTTRVTHRLTKPSQGLLIPPTVWAEQKYSDQQSVVLVVTDRPFEEADYIRNYEDFLAFRQLRNAA